MTRQYRLLIGVLLSAVVWQSPPVSAQATTPLLSRARLFVDRDKAAVMLNPSGGHVGWIDATSPERPLKILALRPRGGTPTTLANSVVAWQWLFRENEVLTVSLTAAGQQLRRLRLGGESHSLLTAGSVSIVATGRDAPDEAVLNVRGASGTPDGFVKVNLISGQLHPMAELAGYSPVFFDGQLRPVAAHRATQSGTHVDRRTSDGRWISVATSGVVDTVAAGVVAVSRDGSRIAYTSNERSDTTQLEELEVTTGTRRVLATDPGADILRVGATVDPGDGRVQSVVSYRVRMNRHVLKPEMREHFEHLETTGKGEVSVAAQSLDNGTWLVRFFDGGPARLAVYELATRTVTPLFAEVPGLDDVAFAPRHALEVKARDGLTLRADLYLPAGSDVNGDGIPNRPLPTLVFVHGGPWVGFEWNIWEVNRHFQLLANRGYAVIRTSFRGEPGHGKRFVDAGDRQWGTGMMNDLKDVAAYAVARRIADGERTGIFGWSFGGMATAHLLATAPDQFRAGVSLYGVFDLPAALEAPFTQNDFWRQRVGDIRDDAERKRLTAESPLTMAEAIKRPLLLTHGGRDTRVPIEQSEALAAALEKLKRPATFLVFPDEGHDYYARETWMAFWSVAEPFLATHLGGRYEPAGNELAAARGEIRSQQR